MGLDITHDCWHGGYGAFNTWRFAIAEAVDIPLGLMDGYYEVRTIENLRFQLPLWMQEVLDNNLLKHLPIYWNALKPDPIHVLLTHSDCDGIIGLDDQIMLAHRLEEIADKLPLEPFDMKDRARKFAAGLRLANSLGEVVEFQ